MSRTKKLIRNIIILAVLFILFIIMTGLSLSPIKAHERSERSIHYGPSQVVKVENFRDGKLMLCKYDRWFSCDTVNRTLGIFWRFGNQSIGIENDLSKPLCYSWSYSDYTTKVFGIINDEGIARIDLELELGNGEIVSKQTSDFSDDMFLFVIEEDKKNEREIILKSIKAYDKNNKLIYEDNRL